MSYYNSDNTTILATHVIENREYPEHPNTRMLLLHECKNGRREFVIGSYFTIRTELGDPYDKDSPATIDHYSWDWGHYFTKFESAASYWFEEVLGEHTGTGARIDYEPYGPCPKCGNEDPEYKRGWCENGHFIDEYNCPRCRSTWRSVSKHEYSEED